MDELTKKQQKFYDSLISFFRNHLRLPSHREAARFNGMKSANSSVHYHKMLCDKDYLKKDESGHYTFSSPADVWPGGDSNKANATIPVLGEITAGAMQEAIEADLGELSLKHLFPAIDRIFALRVNGMSMKELDITDGDYVLLSKKELNSGDVGAILYDGETTLKKVQKEQSRLRLVPANKEFDDIIIEPDEAEEVRILGKYMGHINSHGIFTSPYQ